MAGKRMSDPADWPIKTHFKQRGKRGYYLVPYPKLIELQLAVLAALRDDLVKVERVVAYYGSSGCTGYRHAYYNRRFVVRHFVESFDVTMQLRALRRRKMIFYTGRASKLAPTKAALELLIQHPEF